MKSILLAAHSTHQVFGSVLVFISGPAMEEAGLREDTTILSSDGEAPEDLGFGWAPKAPIGLIRILNNR